jgi:hypothetical protein
LVREALTRGMQVYDISESQLRELEKPLMWYARRVLGKRALRAQAGTQVRVSGSEVCELMRIPASHAYLMSRRVRFFCFLFMAASRFF